MENKKTTKEIVALLIVATACTSFLINSVMLGWSKTRFSADDEVKMRQAEQTTESKDQKSLNCKNQGGKAVFNDYNDYLRCDY